MKDYPPVGTLVRLTNDPFLNKQAFGSLARYEGFIRRDPTYPSVALLKPVMIGAIEVSHQYVTPRCIELVASTHGKAI